MSQPNKKQSPGKIFSGSKLSDFADHGKTNMLIIIEGEQIIYSSPLYMQMMGYSEGDSISATQNNVWENIHQDDQDKIKKIISEDIKKKKPYSIYALRVRTRQGHYIWREDYASYQYDATGKHIRTYVICRELPSSEKNEKEIVPNELNKFKVLIAEDNRVNMILTKDLLEHILPDCQIIEARNGQEAVNLYKQQLPDMVLMDIHMPEKDGYQATREIRIYEDKSGLKKRPIIAITARIHEGERERCLDSGMNDYLPKPIQEADFNYTINKFVNIYTDNNK